MSEARAQILGGVRRSLARDALAPEHAATLETRLRGHAANLVPARAAGLEPRRLVELFEAQASKILASVVRVASLDAVPDAVAEYLAGRNLESELTMAPDPLLDGAPWDKRPLIKIRRGAADGKEPTGLSAAFAAIAETGTLMLVSGKNSPSALNFLPDTHIVVLPIARMVGPMEAAWDRLRQAFAPQGDDIGGASMPRTINFITGPSRTGDIEQKIEMGAHGPRRLHIIVVEDEALR